MTEHITVGETDIKVSGIGRSDLREWVGGIPAEFDVDRVYRWEGIIAGTTVDPATGNVIEVHYKTDDVSGETCLEAALVTNPSGVDPAEEVLWERAGRAERELSGLVSDGGLSAAEALDYWAVEIRGHTASAWAETRGKTHQAISKNVNQAREKLAD